MSQSPLPSEGPVLPRQSTIPPFRSPESRDIADPAGERSPRLWETDDIADVSCGWGTVKGKWIAKSRRAYPWRRHIGRRRPVDLFSRCQSCLRAGAAQSNARLLLRDASPQSRISLRSIRANCCCCGEKPGPTR